MKVVLAQTSRFCHGVERAVTLALEAAANGPVRADGPLLHNRQALDLLARHGVADGGAPGTEASASAPCVLIRAHGAAPARRDEWLRKGLRVVDATCVHVARSQRMAGEANGHVVLAGDAGHAEVLAVAAAATAGCTVVRTVADIETIPDSPPPVLFLAQTTFNARLYREMAAAFVRRFPGATVADTICRATHVRQEEARRLARTVDVMVVVGDCHSANTARLAAIAREAGSPVFLVETAADLDPAALAPFRRAGVTSGASTPGWVTQEVVDRLAGLDAEGGAERPLRLVRTLLAGPVPAALAGAGLALAAQVITLGGAQPFLVAGAGLAGVWAHTRNRRRHSGCRAVPRRSVLQALLPPAAWAIALAGAAWLAGGGAGPALAAGLFVFLLGLAADMLRDLHDTSSDRLMGLATIPLRLGPERAGGVAAAVFTAAAAIPPVLGLAGIPPGAGPEEPVLLPLLAIAAVWGREILEIQRHGGLRDAVLLRSAADGIGVIAGVAAVAALGFA